MATSAPQRRRLEGKVAIITGAGTGIGEAIAHKFCKEGARIVANGLPEDPVLDVVQSIHNHGADAIPYLGDVSEEHHARACIQAAIDKYGWIDILVNNAGVFLVTCATEDYPLEDFERTLRFNVRSTFLMTRFALPYLQSTRGCVLSAGDAAGESGFARNSVYGATKGWVHAFMRGVAQEQARHGVRANCVCAGPVDTAWTHKETAPMDARMERALIEATPMARRATPEEIANVYAFLASDEASYVTGALWMVDGGVSVAIGNAGAETPAVLRQPPEGSLKSLHHPLDGMRAKKVHVVR